MKSRLIATALTALSLFSAPLYAQTKITLWSHWADQEAKVAFVEAAARQFEAKNAGTKVEITWYQKGPLYAALKTALRAGQAPDIFYAETDQIEYIDNGFLLDLSNAINWQNIEPYARTAWTFNGKAYGFPLEVWSVEMYYNRDLMKKIGVTVPDDGVADYLRHERNVGFTQRIAAPCTISCMYDKMAPLTASVPAPPR